MDIKVSLCMIARNEESNIARCLNSVKAAVDEIIVVDTGSTDQTREIARGFGAKVYSFIWNNNFSDARNASLEKAAGEWILFLDADEELLSGSGEVIRKLVQDKSVDGYLCKIINYMGNEKWQEENPDITFRLFRNDKEYRFHGAIHEQIYDVINEKKQQTNFCFAEGLVILHFGYLEREISSKDKFARNLKIIEKEIVNNPENEVLRYSYGMELYRSQFYDKAVIEFEKLAAKNPNLVFMPKLFRYLVLASYDNGKFEQALNYVAKGLTIYPNYADLWYYGGLSSFALKDYGKAYHYFTTALKMPEQPDSFAPFCGTRGFRTHYYLGQIAEVFCNEEEAMRHYIDSLRDNPNFLLALEAIVRLLEPHKDAVYAKMALEIICDFDTPKAKLIIADILYRQGASSLSLQYIDEYLSKLSGSLDLFFRRGICLTQQKRFSEGIKMFDSIPGGHALFLSAKLNKMLCCWLSGEKRKVNELTKEFLTSGLSLNILPTVLLLKDTQGKKKVRNRVIHEDGVAVFMEVLKLIIEAGDEVRAGLLLDSLATDFINKQAFIIAQLFYKSDQLTSAQAYVKMYLDKTSDCAAGYYLLAQISERLNLNFEAIGCYRQAMRLEPKEPKYAVRLIKLYERMRQDALIEVAEKYPNVLTFQSLLKEVSAGT